VGSTLVAVRLKVIMVAEVEEEVQVDSNSIGSDTWAIVVAAESWQMFSCSWMESAAAAVATVMQALVLAIGDTAKAAVVSAEGRWLEPEVALL